MKKELRKSTENQAMSTYYATSCGCLNYCGLETASWYPREAETSEYHSLIA